MLERPGLDVPVRRGRPDVDEGQDRQRRREVEDPAPARARGGRRRARPRCRSPARASRSCRLREHERAEERPDGHAQERRGADEADARGSGHGRRRGGWRRRSRAARWRRRRRPGWRAPTTICSSVWAAPQRKEPSAKRASAPIIRLRQPVAVGGPARQRRGRDVGDEVDVMIHEARRRSVQPERSTMMRGRATAVMKSSMPTRSTPRQSAASMTARAPRLTRLARGPESGGWSIARRQYRPPRVTWIVSSSKAGRLRVTDSLAVHTRARRA